MSDDSSNPDTDPTDDAWDLDDDELSLGQPIKPTPMARNLSDRKEPLPEGVERRAEEERKPAPAPQPSPAQMTPRRESAPPEEKERTVAVPDPEPAPEPRRSRRESPATARKEANPESSGLEKVAIFIALAAILAVAAGGLLAFNSEAPNSDNIIEFTEDFPVVSENAVISGVETWWREPVRSGEKIDVGVVIGVQLIPCGSLTLESSGTTTLQASFRDGKDNLIGDTINLPVENGKFLASGTNEITFNSTAGFSNAPDIHPYTIGDIAPWSLVIVDEKSPDKIIINARVRPNVIE
jgi:hypothetical protein